MRRPRILKRLEFEDFDFHRALAIEQDALDAQRQPGGYVWSIDSVQQNELIATRLQNSLSATCVNLAADADLKLHDSHLERLQNFTDRVWIELSARLVSQHDRFLAQANLHLVYALQSVEVDFRKPGANSAGDAGGPHGHLLHLARGMSSQYESRRQ